mgnify:CR=1 FL=1
MFCIDNRCTDIYFNLAAEEYLLKQKRGNFFMLWQSEPSVVIGKHQSVAAEADERFLDEKGITLARRFSGGGAVYHDRGNINLSFIETVKQPDFGYYLQQVVDFLEKVGISAYADQRLGIYVDERKEKLQKLEEKAKRELGMLPPKEFSPEDIRGKFVQGTKHLKRRKESGRKPMTYGALFVAILVLLYILHYLVTGEFTF